MPRLSHRELAEHRLDDLLDKDCPAVQAAVRAISKGPR
jgi:hypothetical protein